MTWFMVFFLLLVAHAVVDFSLQGDTMAINKNPNSNTPLQKHVPWYYWLGAHAMQHAGAVALITNSVWLGKYNIHVDQFLHLACKITWLLVWIFC
jgi:hypothetical protein